MATPVPNSGFPADTPLNLDLGAVRPGTPPGAAMPPVPQSQPGAEAVIAPPNAANSDLFAQLGIPPSEIAGLANARGKANLASDVAVDTLKKTQAERAALREQMAGIPKPTPPDFVDTPEAPPAMAQTDTLRVFGQFLPLLGILGGLSIKNNAAAALNAASSAMEAAKANDAEALKRAHEQFQLELDAALRKNERAQQIFQNASTLFNTDMDQAMAQLNALAGEEQNLKMQADVAAGNVKAIQDDFGLRMGAWEKLTNASLKMREINQKAAGGNLAGAEQKGRLALALPNIVAAHQELESIEAAEGKRHGASRANPFNRDLGMVAARVAEAVPWDGGSAARMFGGKDYQAYENAARSFESNVLPIFSGAAVSPSEAQRFIRANIPQFNDTPETLATKAANRAALINQAAVLIGAAPPFPEAGFFHPLTGMVERQPYMPATPQTPAQQAPATQNVLPPGDYIWSSGGGVKPMQ